MLIGGRDTRCRPLLNAGVVLNTLFLKMMGHFYNYGDPLRRMSHFRNPKRSSKGSFFSTDMRKSIIASI